MKKHLIISIILFSGSLLYSQNQIKPEWPSLADTPWPISVGDMQATGRSEFIGPRTGNVI